MKYRVILRLDVDDKNRNYNEILDKIVRLLNERDGVEVKELFEGISK